MTDRPPPIRTAAALLAACAATALADTIHVPADQPTIQAGIDAAVNGDEVVVAPGTYNEIIDFAGKAIIVRSTGGSSVTTIDAAGVPDPGDGLPVVRFDNGEGLDSVLEGFTLTGGTGDTGLSGGSTNGGGVVISMSAATLRGCVIEGNTAESWGGGFLVFQGELALEDCTVRMNHAGNDGGAMYLLETTGLTIDGCDFSDNTSPVNVAGINFEFTSGPVVITDSLFEGHVSGTGFGSALAAGGHDGPVTIDRCVFRDNALNNGQGAAVFVDSIGVNRITNSLFVGNASNRDGGAINFEGAPGSYIAGCVFVDNSSGDEGGAIDNRNSRLIYNCSFSGNTASNGGSAVRSSGSGNAIYTNCVFWDQTGSSPIAIFGSGTVTVNNSIVEGGWAGAGTGNLDLDPLYADPMNEDLSLMAGSPAIDSGDTPAAAAVLTSSTDLTGAARLTDDPTTADTGVPVFGQAIDMGAYEFGSTPPPLIELQPQSLVVEVGLIGVFVVDAPDAIAYQWYKDGEPIFDGGMFNGTSTPLLGVSVNDISAEGLYSVEVTDGSRTETSMPAALVILGNPCPADFNEDGSINTLDVLNFLNAWNAGCP